MQTTEEATVYVEEFDLFFTVKLFEDTLAVLSLGKLCEDHGYSYEYTSGHKPHLIKHGKRIKCNTENYMLIVVHGLPTMSAPSCSSTPTPPSSSTQDIEGSIPDPASIGSESEDRLAREDPLHRPGEIPKFDEHMDHEPARRNPLHPDIPEMVARFHGKSRGGTSALLSGNVVNMCAFMMRCFLLGLSCVW